MFDISTAFPDDRFDLAYSTDRAARNRHETRIAALRVRKHIALTEKARNRVRSRLTAEPAPADAPSVGGLLTAWDAHVAGARAHFAAQDEAYRLARLVLEHDGIEGPSPVWRAMLNDLHDLNSPTEA